MVPILYDFFKPNEKSINNNDHSNEDHESTVRRTECNNSVCCSIQIKVMVCIVANELVAANTQSN